MIDIVLFEPEIPPNTGNIIRLCANTGARLHLIEPLGFSMDEKALRRAGLDYHEFADIKMHPNWPAAKAALAGRRVFAMTTKGSAPFHEARFAPDDVLMFGPETRGLPAEVLDEFSADTRLRLPMRADSRSLNLSNTVAIAVYEAWRQLNFIGASGRDLPSK
ncbi:MAG: tRNA (uridine(34)/cytosine(34)/5-carboxymethylaminomethyluridine(34)-2'-O)-methyltransferase TrmL [Halothiobacillus sp. 35-54-62]|jgi:tRNA (cytidine/uridine-2'-O-)-methyltransferase|nr:MAG: tRNA (uridine(34)/cytosine(34)/5-carboxymethylaminomethyluridine(34)-2'-O)-methyltransferase TrmL [Halothiobacillus sp. 35-54-62]HQS03356.1 tRNA (uridine(34)/cytosine(34)/5-carboxymethylaminomethyluridine(34)-2'-O)-methyltransferase TrmL [Halothiobacillus sp.]HQS28562.1 tRNA (uridine(34)/cytosine(34)/5-carboxymethylaminomethyluridine(34)-2'-O)-methyltransferase TrmL [Halothiobacillus sp.]